MRAGRRKNRGRSCSAFARQSFQVPRHSVQSRSFAIFGRACGALWKANESSAAVESIHLIILPAAKACRYRLNDRRRKSSLDLCCARNQSSPHFARHTLTEESRLQHLKFLALAQMGAISPGTRNCAPAGGRSPEDRRGSQGPARPPSLTGQTFLIARAVCKGSDLRA